MGLKIIGLAFKVALFLLRKFDRMRGTTSNMTAAEFRLNPYESFHRLRRISPIIRSYANQGWMVTGYEQAQDVLRDGRFSNDIHWNWFFLTVLRVGMRGKPIPFVDHPTLLSFDPPDHTRLRKLVSPGFVNSYIQSLAPRIEQLTDELLEDIGDSFDLIQTIAKPLPALVIAEMLGVPVRDRALFQTWSDDLTGATILGRPDLLRKASDAETAMRSYLTSLLESKKGDQDFISILLTAHEAGDRLTHDELIGTCVLLLSAGHETTTRLIGNGLYALLTHPEQMQRLRDDPTLPDSAIEEMLRFEPPFQMTIRFVTEKMSLHGAKFRKGQMVLVCFAGANRDPLAFPDPDRFDITRRDNKHISFGYGFHMCLGMALARLEAQIVFRQLLDRYQDITCLEDSPAWGINPFFRDLQQLRLAVIKK